MSRAPLVLIPGLMCDARLWGGLPAALHPWPVVHALPLEGESIAEMAAQILAGAPPRFALAGLSMGAIVAMEIIAQSPERVERLALMDTSPLADGESMRRRREGWIARALGGDLAGLMREALIPIYQADPPDPAIADLCLEMAMDLGPQVFARQSRALMNRADRTEAIARFPGPALILTGAQDKLCPMALHERMHGLAPCSRLVVIEGAGHLPPLERPLSTLEAVKSWLSM